MNKEINDNSSKLLKITNILSILPVINTFLIILAKRSNNDNSLTIAAILNIIIFLYLIIVIVKNIINYKGDNFKKIFTISFLPLLITIICGIFLKNEISGIAIDNEYTKIAMGIILNGFFNLHILLLSLILQAGVLYKRNRL